MSHQSANLFSDIIGDHSDEVVEILHQSKNVRIEQIISRGHASPDGFWFDQKENEWVTVLAGNGTLEFKDPEETIEMNVGDHLFIPAHRQHRVISTSHEVPTIWLAIFFN